MKKGFTLAELLGVIVIIGLLLLLLIPLIINGIKSRQDDVKYIQDDIMEEIAGQYMDLDKEKYPGFAGDIYCISFKELSDAGLLDNVLGSLGDDDSYDINKTAIQVNVLDGGKKTYEVTNTNECSNKQSQNIIITVTPPNNKWALSKTVTIKYPDLGSGKTVFTKGFAHAMEIDETVTSPTFNIIKEYLTGDMPLYHMDVYRLNEKSDELGIEEYYDKGGVTIIEWADLIPDLLPPNRLDIKFKVIDEDTRVLLITPHGKEYEDICEAVL